MTKLFKIKNLIPVPKDGDSAVRYYLTATLAMISADSDGKPKAPGSTPITFSQWKKVGNAPAALSADYNIHLFTELNGVKEYFGPTNYKSQTFGVAIQMATGKDCLGADLCTDAGAVIATLGIPVNRDGIPGQDGSDGTDGADGNDGADAVLYEMVPSVGAINADNDGRVTTGAIAIRVYKTVGETRTDITPESTIAGLKPPYRVQFKVENAWTECVNVGTGSGMEMRMEYGVPGSAVATVTNTLDLRLQKLKDGTYTTVYQMAPIQVVKNGAQGGRGRWYYFDGYFVSTKEYQASDAKAPYVAFDWEDTVTQNGVSTKVTRTSYYMLVANTNKASDDTLIAPRTQAASGVWELMEDNFKYMITEAIFSAFAKLGSAVFSGDWMISQYGNGGTNHNYHLFNSFDEAGWHPNIGIDFKRGEIYAGNGKVHFAKDGSGQLAGGNISWDTAGNSKYEGRLRARTMTLTEGTWVDKGEYVEMDLEQHPGTHFKAWGERKTAYMAKAEDYMGTEVSFIATGFNNSPQLYDIEVQEGEWFFIGNERIQTTQRWKKMRINGYAKFLAHNNGFITGWMLAGLSGSVTVISENGSTVISDGFKITNYNS